MNSFFTILSTIMLVGILGNPVQSRSLAEDHNRDKNGTSGVHENAQSSQTLQYKECESLVFNTALKESFGAIQFCRTGILPV
ncbi:MAG TPA: hypothetical protein DIW81_04615 [Planctomycetaceae bacterium]|nr:hypothetical protein [Rubinisphaera sp.]HCS50865.1 hypothetical protein [Planctomycetaceae bacterium]